MTQDSLLINRKRGISIAALSHSPSHGLSSGADAQTVSILVNFTGANPDLIP